MSCPLTGACGCNGESRCSLTTFCDSVKQFGLNCEELPFSEIKRQLVIYPPNSDTAIKTGLTKAGLLRPRMVGSNLESGEPLGRVAKFMRLLDHLSTAPWANTHFDINADILKRLTAAHVKLIAPGVSNTAAMHIIDPKNTLEGAGNLVWVTNRQQGKTTTLARFLAAMSIASPAGGLLFTVYSTSLDRSVELVKAAKAYIFWMLSGGGHHPEFNVTLQRNNERMFVISNGEAENTIIARPKKADSCRGDAPKAALFDEIGFISRQFWEEFAFPLLQVGGRVFTCATTPPPPNSFFSTFINQVKENNAKNDFFFALINHSLTCAECLEAGIATECCHNLQFLPPWKSLVTLNSMLSLAVDKDAYQMEVYGVLGGSGNEYIPAKLIDAALQRPKVTEICSTGHLWVAIDPASHGTSEFAGVAFVLNEKGVHVVIGMYTVNMQRCQTTQVQQVVHQFLTRVREHPLVGPDLVLVPIIECNNNEILAMSILTACRSYPPLFLPWENDLFSTGVSPGIGVWMTHENKMAALQSTYQCFLDGRVSFAENFVIADRTAFMPTASNAGPEDVKQKFYKQLSAMQDQPDGTVSGKHIGNDDLACAFLLGVYWSLCARAVLMSE